MPSPCHVLWVGTTNFSTGRHFPKQQQEMFILSTRITLARPTPEQSKESVVITILSLRRRNLETERSLRNQVIMPPRQEDKIMWGAHQAWGRCLAHDNVVNPADSFLHRELTQVIFEYTQRYCLPSECAPRPGTSWPWLFGYHFVMSFQKLKESY